jgi:hypothetical protein
MGSADEEPAEARPERKKECVSIPWIVVATEAPSSQNRQKRKNKKNKSDSPSHVIS